MRAPMAMAVAGTDFRLDKASLGPVGVLWDMENCPIPGDVHSDAVAGNIRMALKVHPDVDSFVTTFSAYGDFNQFPRRLREGCQHTGINLIDVPNGRKDAADKAIIVDMFLFALDNPPPCTILLISGHVDFASALHKLGQRGYTVLLAVPAAARVASSLCNAGQHVWDWPSVARGEGFVPVKALCHTLPRNLLERHSIDYSDHVLADDPCLCCSYRAGKCFVNVCSKHSQNRTAAITALKNAGASNTQTVAELNKDNDTHELWVQPGDMEGLKQQLVKLLKIHGGVLNLTKVSSEYRKLYGRPLFVYEYGSLKLNALLIRIGSPLKIVNTGNANLVVLHDCLPTAQRSSQMHGNASHKDLEQQGGSSGNAKRHVDGDLEEVILLRAKDQTGSSV